MDGIVAGSRKFAVPADYQGPASAQQQVKSAQQDTSEAEDTEGQNLTSMAKLSAEASNKVIKVTSTNSGPVTNRYAEIHEKATNATVADIDGLEEKALAHDREAVAILLDIVVSEFLTEGKKGTYDVSNEARKALKDIMLGIKSNTLLDRSYFPGDDTGWGCDAYYPAGDKKTGELYIYIKCPTPRYVYYGLI